MDTLRRDAGVGPSSRLTLVLEGVHEVRAVECRKGEGRHTWSYALTIVAVPFLLLNPPVTTALWRAGHRQAGAGPGSGRDGVDDL